MPKTEKISGYRKLNRQRALAYGCEGVGTGLVFRSEIMKGSFKIELELSDSSLTYKLTDSESGDEYTLAYTSASGAFVGAVRTECEALIADIIDGCYDSEVFKNQCTKGILEYAKSKYGTDAEFLWERTPENAVLRNPKNGKWYAAILTVSGKRLGLECDDPIEIIDLHASPEEVAQLIKREGYLSAYHMNKKHWYTVLLDGSVPTEEIFERIDKSFDSVK